jgi:peptide methionine sulfoxide reductase msrA/msrB
MYKTIYLAGGCFWGVEAFLSALPGVVSTKVGYANGFDECSNPTYEEVCTGITGHAEAVQVIFDPEVISLSFLLDRYFEIIDPTSLNRQGADTGTQYRTGIYFEDPSDEPLIRGSIQLLSERVLTPVVVEVGPLVNFALAQDYHQHYLDKNRDGYCHIPTAQIDGARCAIDTLTTQREDKRAALRETLSPLQFEVTQNDATEPPFDNEFNDRFSAGIYADVTTGQPLFASCDKFESGCGWPAFSRPLSDDLLTEKDDQSQGRPRVEVRSTQSDAHLGHVFKDGPIAAGGLRYCINSAALRFIPLENMDEEGYEEYRRYVDGS